MVLPVVSAISPSSGTLYGGTVVTLTGSGFSVGSPVVYFGNKVSSTVVVVSDTSMTAVAPAALGTSLVYITVVTSNGTSLATPSNQFIYFQPQNPVYYTTNNIFFDPQAGYVFFGQLDLAQNPILPRQGALTGATVTPTHVQPANYGTVVINLQTGQLSYFIQS